MNRLDVAAEFLLPPRTEASAELHARAAELFARSRRLPRFGWDAVRLALVDEANTMLLEAKRIDDEDRRQEKLRRVHLWEVDRRSAAAFGEKVSSRPPIEGGPNRKARRAERAKGWQA